MIHVLDTVFGPSVISRVAVRSTAEVNLRYSERVASVVASGMVKVSLASAAISFVP